VGYLDSRQFSVSLVAGLEGDEFRGRRQRQQNRTRINHAAISAPPAPTASAPPTPALGCWLCGGGGRHGGRAPNGLAILGVEAEKVAPLRHADEHAGFEHW